MTKKKNLVDLLRAFDQSVTRQEFKGKYQAELDALYPIVEEEMTDETPMSAHTIWRKMLKFHVALEAEAEELFGKIEGGDAVAHQIHLDTVTKRNNLRKAVCIDFDKVHSEHDLVRTKINYLEGMMDYPFKLADIEHDEQENERMAEEVRQLEAIQEAKINEENEEASE